MAYAPASVHARAETVSIDMAQARGESGLPAYELIFGIPATHRLTLLRSRARLDRVLTETLEFQEFEPTGVLVARYELELETDLAGGARQGCWRKYGMPADPGSSPRETPSLPRRPQA